MTQFFEQIAGDILALNTDLTLLRSWGAQPELWLRNQIALQMYRRYSASSIHIGCEISYQNSSNERIDLIINRGLTYYIEIKVENQGSTHRDWLNSDSPLAQDTQKVLQFRTHKNAHRCLVAVAFTARRISDLQDLYSDALSTLRVFRQQVGLAVFVTNLDPLA